MFVMLKVERDTLILPPKVSIRFTFPPEKIFKLITITLFIINCLNIPSRKKPIVESMHSSLRSETNSYRFVLLFSDLFITYILSRI